MGKLIAPEVLDVVLGYPTGRSARLANQGRIPHVVLPDGEIRFDPEAIEQWLEQIAVSEKVVDERQ